MFTPDFMIALFAATALFGAFRCLIFLRRLRRHRDYPNAKFTWYERPLSSFKYETANWIATTSTWTAIAVIGIFSLLQVASPTAPSFPLPSLSSDLIALIWATAGGGLGAIGFIWGQSTFQPIAQAIAGKAYFAISADGILYAGRIFPWSSFERVTHDRDQGVIRLWSASTPGTISFALSPLPPQSPSELLVALGANVQFIAPGQSPNWGVNSTFPATMALLSLLAILTSSILYSLLGWLGLVANAILLFLFLNIAGRYMLQSIAGGKHPPARLEELNQTGT